MIFCAIFGVACIASLFVISDSLVHRQGGIFRIFPPHFAVELNEIDIVYNSYYFAGATNEYIYLGNVTAPLQLLAITTSLEDTLHIRLDVENLNTLTYYNVSVKIDSPYFYFADGAIPYIYKGIIGEWKARSLIEDSVYFLDYAPIRSSSFAIRSLTQDVRENTLGKITSNPFSAHFNTALLEKQLDGVFCTDGMLHFEKDENRVVYVYYYRNQYIVSDSSLNLDYRGTTIDTTSRVQIKTSALSLSDHGSQQLASPPHTVNKHSTLSHNLLFIHSNVMAGNENKSEFNQASVIDVYNLDEDRYQFSFYIYDRGKEKLKNFMVLNDRLFAIFDHYVRCYKLDTGIVSNRKSNEL